MQGVTKIKTLVGKTGLQNMKTKNKKNWFLSFQKMLGTATATPPCLSVQEPSR